MVKPTVDLSIENTSYVHASQIYSDFTRHEDFHIRVIIQILIGRPVGIFTRNFVFSLKYFDLIVSLR